RGSLKGSRARSLSLPCRISPKNENAQIKVIIHDRLEPRRHPRVASASLADLRNDVGVDQVHQALRIGRCPATARFPRPPAAQPPAETSGFFGAYAGGYILPREPGRRLVCRGVLGFVRPL